MVAHFEGKIENKNLKIDIYGHVRQEPMTNDQIQRTRHKECRFIRGEENIVHVVD